MVVDSKGENSIIVLEGANGELTVTDVDALATLLRPGDVISTQYESPAEVVRRALEAAEVGADYQ